MNFRKLVKEHNELMDIDYKEVAIAKVVKQYGYQIEDEENLDYDYSDYKGYLNLTLIAIPDKLSMSHTKGEWICNDIDAATGELLIQNEAGRLIAEVYNNEDVPLIKSAPKLLKLLKEYMERVKNGGLTEEFDNEVKKIIKEVTD